MITSELDYKDTIIKGGQASVSFVSGRELVVKKFNTYETFRSEYQIYNSLEGIQGVLMPICKIPESQEIIFKEAIDGNLKEIPADWTFADLISIMRSLVKIVKKVHSRGYLHMDIKPENIVREGKHIWLIDFGLAVRTGTDLRMKGTKKYMPPETLLKNASWMSVCEASDWWSVGMTMYYLWAKWMRLDDFLPFDVKCGEDDCWYTALVDRVIVNRIMDDSLYDLLFSPYYGLLNYDNRFRLSDNFLLEHPLFVNKSV